MAKEVATVKDQAQLPAEFAGLEEYAGQGLNDLDTSDHSVPFIKVLEKNSPEIESLKGAKPGMFVNTATQELFESFRFVPACREHLFVEWVPIDNGGGLVASYGLDTDIARWAKTKRGKIKLKSGNDLVETFYLYGVWMPEEDSDAEPQPAVIAFTSTRIRTYKSLVNRSDAIMLRGASGRKFKAPWFCHVWRIGSDKKQDGNQTWYVYTAEFDRETAEASRLPADHPVVQLGAEMVRMKNAGELTVSQEAAAMDQPDLPDRDTGGGSREESAPPF